jgi:hypothetical protein
MTLGERIDALQRLKAKKKEAEVAVSQINEQISLAEADLIEWMDEQGVVQSTGHLARATVDKKTLPHVTDWDEFHKYILENKYVHLLERRPSVSGCREIFENAHTIPGVVPFVKRIVRLTSL